MLENFRLRVFREVALRRNFRRAAEALFITQPAVTQHIKALESELQTALFDRGTTGVRLTSAGEALLRRAEESEKLLSQAAEDISALRGEVSGTLRLAASTTIAQYILPGVLGDFLRQHGSVDLALESANTATVVQRVLEGDVTLGLIEGPAHRTQLHVSEWLRDELVLVVPPGHEWAEKKIRPTDLSEANLLLRESGSGTREVLEEALAAVAAPFTRGRAHMELSSTEALLACIEAGLGVGFASRFAVQRQLRLGTLAIVKVQGLRVRRTLSLARLRTPELRGPAAAFADTLKLFARKVKVERQRT